MTRRARTLLRLLPTIFAIPLSGCAAGRPVLPPSVPDGPAGFSAEYQIAWTESARVRKARLAATFQPPEKLRLEILDPLGASRAVLVATEDGAILLDPVNREFRFFSRAREALKDLTGFALDADLLAALLLGDPARARGLECRPGGNLNAPERTCLGPGGDPSLRVRRGGREWEVQCPEAAPLRIDVEAPSAHGAGPPGRIRVHGGSAEISIDLRLRDLRFLSPPEGLFSIQPPASFRNSSGNPSRPPVW